MKKIFLSLFLILAFYTITVSSSSYTRYSRSRTMAYIKAQCRITRYPQLCVKTLSRCVKSPAQSPQQLAQYALSVGLVKARNTKNYVTQVAIDMKRSKAREYQAVKDCLNQISDSVDQLTQSINELRRINTNEESNFLWQSSNVESWLSTAVTDATTCINGFSGHAMGGKVKATIKAKVINLGQVCSNALALFNRFVAKHRAGVVAIEPKA